MNSLFKGLLASVTIASLAFPFTTPAQDFFGPAKSGDLLSLREALSAEEEIDPASLVRPIYFAAQRGHADVVALLLEHGAPANAKLNFGTALQIAARGDHTDVVTLLLGAGADPNLPGGEESKTPLDEAAERGALNAAEVLLMHGADVNARTRRDHPPIHLAARRERTEMVTFLQNHGAQPRHVNQIDLKDLVGVDVKAGRMAAAECLGCRAVVRGEASPGRYVAPDLDGILGREKASLAEFPYSNALKKLEGVWSPNDVNQFIADPTGTASGTNMGHAGVQDLEKRLAIIAFLASFSSD